MEPIAKIRSKVKNCGLKTATIVEACKAIDRNRDGLIHFDDLEMVMTDLLAKRGVELSRREWRQIMAAITNDPTRGDVIYEHLYEVLDAKEAEVEEKWFDPSTGSVDVVLNNNANRRMQSPSRLTSSSHQVAAPARSSRLGGSHVPVQKGSIGHWLQTKAYPTEVANFKCFIQALEKYERDSGEKIETTSDGFVISLGPGLKARVTYTL